MITLVVKSVGITAATLLLTGCVSILPFVADAGKPPPYIDTLEIRPCPSTVVVVEDTTDELSRPYDPDRPPRNVNTDAMVEKLSDYAEKLLRFRESNAESCVREVGFGWRVIERDGELFPVTMDYRTDRINASIRGGLVADVSIG